MKRRHADASGRPRPAQAGAALLTAMLTVALVATLAAGALWQQWRSVEVEAAERARAQSLWVLAGALDWARLILREDARSGVVDHLAEPWAVPLEEARLSTFLATDAGNPGQETDPGADQAFLSGLIMDLQARMNVAGLLDNGKVSETGLKAFARLFQTLGLPPAELTAMAENLRLAKAASTGGEDIATAPLMPERVEQLVWLGLSPRSLEVLRPHITLLPVSTPVNLNTASATVLFACIPSLDMAQAQQLVNARKASHFRSLPDATAKLGPMKEPLNAAWHSVSSQFFEIRGRLRLEQTVVEERSVVRRDGLEVKTLWRERGTPEPQTKTLQ